MEYSKEINLTHKNCKTFRTYVPGTQNVFVGDQHETLVSADNTQKQGCCHPHLSLSPSLIVGIFQAVS